MIKRRFLIVTSILALLAIAGCASNNPSSANLDSGKAGAPDDATAHRKNGEKLLAAQKLNEAIAEFNLALQSNPKDAEAYLDRGTAVMFQGDSAKAIADFDTAIQLKPDYAAAYGCRGLAHGRAGMFKESLADFDYMTKIDPQDAWAWSYQAELLATCKDDSIRNGPKAVEAAAKACELSNWKVGFHIYILAAAYAECGDWDHAAAYEQKALQVGAVSAEERNRMALNLTLYKFHLPFHDPTIFQ